MPEIPPEMIQEDLGRCACGNLLTKGPGLEKNLCHSCNKLSYKPDKEQDEAK